LRYGRLEWAAARTSNTASASSKSSGNCSALTFAFPYGDIHCDPPRLVFGERLAAARRSELALIIDVCEPLPVVISA
jgi:hypothetical protein